MADQGTDKNAAAMASLENLRIRLLDLSFRNRLLNFSHSKMENIRIIDELPDPLHETLLAENALRLAPVPEPTRQQLLDASYIVLDENGQEKRIKKDPNAEHWARWLGLTTDYTLPEPDSAQSSEGAHCDPIQTLLLPHALETKLRGLRSKAETALQEMGANILYLALGFLQWFESPDSEVERLAPLVLMPVRLKKEQINRTTHAYEYSISYTGEDLLPNLSLQEKLLSDFGMALPDFEENLKPEKYFAAVQALIEKYQPRWRLQRFGTLALFNFSKLLMYLDLDARRWPSDASLTEHPIISRLLGAAEEKEERIANFDDEYAIDDIPEIHEQYPLIEDADSSQHSALIDVLKGKNLVIEGPPGTGKSQTITNIIAAAIAHGKSVLFVSEKMAALEVVKRRLDRAGLGDFCLELHSHKTQKRKVLDEIQHSLNRQGHSQRPMTIDVNIARYESLRDQLRRHADLVNQFWKGTGRTAYQILATATRYREALPRIHPAELHPEGLDGHTFDAVAQKETLDFVLRFGKAFADLRAQLADGTQLHGHPWYGIVNPRLQFFDADKVCVHLRDWQGALAALSDLGPTLATALLLEETAVPHRLRDLRQLVADIQKIPPLQGDEYLACLPQLRGGTLKAAQRYLQASEEARELYRKLGNLVGPETLEKEGLYEKLKEAEQLLTCLGVPSQFDLQTVARLSRDMKRLQAKLEAFEAPVAEVLKHAGDECYEVIGVHEQGLQELALLTNLVHGLGATLRKYRDDRFDNEELDELLPGLSNTLKELRVTRNQLAEEFRLEHLPSAEALETLYTELAAGKLFRWCSDAWRATRKQVLALGRPETSFRRLQKSLPQLAEYVRAKNTLENNARFKELLGEHFNSLETADDDLVALRTWYRSIRQHYGFGFGAKARLGDTVLTMPSALLKALCGLQNQGLSNQVAWCVTELHRIKEALPNVKGFKQGTGPLVGSGGVLPKVVTTVEKALQACSLLTNRKDINLEKLTMIVRQLAHLNGLEAECKELEAQALIGAIGGPFALHGDHEMMFDVARRTLVLAEIVFEHSFARVLMTSIEAEPSFEKFRQLFALGERLNQALQHEAKTAEAYASLVTLDVLAWCGEAEDHILKLSTRNARALSNERWLGNWLDYVRLRQDMQQKGLSRLAVAVENGEIEVEEIEAGYQLGVSNYFSTELLTQTSALAQFWGRDQEAIQQQFRDYDQKLKRLQQEKIAWQIAQRQIPAGSASGRVSDFSGLTLLQRECGKKKRHIPIRQLIERAGEALVTLKPCFMMGPMSVAQYLAPGRIQFDLVVMDEASQIKPQDALGAIARGTQIIVVGDPKQLPPTSFFDRLVSDEEDDPTTLEESESILDATLPMFTARRLRWHYRSRHESLIAFSNQQFYNGNLILFPSPHNISHEYGVKLSRIQRGRFVNRRNAEEARAVAEAVREHLLHRQNESLGVVAMNAEQREQIERAVEVLVKEDECFRLALDRDSSSEEPLFIKNLENVQGDEREVIYISFTYGPQEVGHKVPQRFGPINSEAGWRRLNVLFTRSRKRMQVFSSMGADDIVISENSKRGVRALKDFLFFAERGMLPQMDYVTDREPDSDFEVAVASALANAGYECTPQVGVAGYFIDLAIKDPGNPGRYLMGIECDGATYHSAKSVRDRDRLRQEILEGLGWRIRRIWSTDWYKNSQAEITRILQELEALKTTVPVEQEHLAESSQIETIVEELDNEEKSVADYCGGDESLADQLRAFDTNVIGVEMPNTPAEQKLLRPAMLEALLEYRPTSKSEFLEIMPPYLRQATAAAECKRYLERVLAIIGGAETFEDTKSLLVHRDDLLPDFRTS